MIQECSEVVKSEAPAGTEAPGAIAAHDAMWHDAVMQIADRVHRAFPTVLKGRIEAATALALEPGKVQQDDEGVWHVAASKGGWYEVNGTCSCPDFPKAHEGWCKHRTAVGIVRRASELTVEDLCLDPEEFFAESEHESESPEETPLQQSIDPRWIVRIQGKPFVLYSGLLAMAHERGLQALSARWTFNDADLSLAEATAVFPFGTYTEAGDSSQANVGKKVALHWRRMALVRAKARCLRDALNVAELCALEEVE